METQLLKTILAMMVGDEAASVQIINSEPDVEPLEAEETRMIEVDFTSKGILNVVYLKATAEGDFDVTIYNAADGTLEYRTERNREFCYDTVGVPYISRDGEDKLWLEISNNSADPLEFEIVRIRGLNI